MQPSPDCSNSENLPVSRRGFVQTVGVAAAVAAAPRVGVPDEPAKLVSESLVTKLYNSLTPTQKKSICFDWDHKDDRGLLRMHVSNNWQITGDHKIATGFYTKDQQEIIVLGALLTRLARSDQKTIAGRCGWLRQRTFDRDLRATGSG